MPVFVEWFYTAHQLLHAAELIFFIGKPGPGSVSEALATHLPVIVECNAWTLPQERYNAEWVLEKEVGMVLPSFKRIEGAVAELIQPVTLARYRANTRAMHNRAVFEIPAILEKILRRSRKRFSEPAACVKSQGNPVAAVKQQETLRRQQSKAGVDRAANYSLTGADERQVLVVGFAGNAFQPGFARRGPLPREQTSLHGSA